MSYYQNMTPEQKKKFNALVVENTKRYVKRNVNAVLMGSSPIMHPRTH